MLCFFVFQQKTAYEMRISDWSSDVCSSDLVSNPAVAFVASRDEEKGTGRYNGGGISDPEIDALLDEATSTLDEEARGEILRKVSELTFDRLWVLPDRTSVV